jgi:tRNA modification GTPase
MTNRVERLTSATPGAIGALSLTGPTAGRLVENFFRSPGGLAVRSWQFPSARFGRWLISESIVEEVVLVCHSPDRFELHCHGGFVVNRIIEQLNPQRASAIDDLASSPDRLTIEQQAQVDLQQATSEATAAILLDQFRGALSTELSRLQVMIHAEQLLPATTALEELLRYATLGEHLIHPWQIQLAGPPNVGKSSLLNRIIGYQRAIVHESAGTTRDLVQVNTALNGWPFSFIDSAGVREDRQLLEAESIGIERALSAGQRMDAILLVTEPAGGLTDVHFKFRQLFPTKVIVVLNQIDRLAAGEATPLAAKLGAMAVSAHSGEGIQELLDALQNRFIPQIPPPGAAVPFRSTHVAALRAAVQYLAEHDFAKADLVIGELLG